MTLRGARSYASPCPLLPLAGAATGSNWGYVVRDDGGVERNARMDIDSGSNRYVIWAAQVRYHINPKNKLPVGYVHEEGGCTFTVLRELEKGTAAQKKALAGQLAAGGGGGGAAGGAP